MNRPALNLSVLVAPETNPELALAIVLLWSKCSDEMERYQFAHHGPFKRFFCPTLHEAKAAETPMHLGFIRLIITNGVFEHLNVPYQEFYWWTRRADTVRNPRYKITHREDLKRGGPGDRVTIRGKDYVIVDCQACETTRYPFGNVTVIPARYVKPGRIMEELIPYSF